MKREELKRYKNGQILIDEIDRITYLIECFKKGAAIRVDSFEDNDYKYLSPDIKKKTRDMYLKDLEKSLKQLQQSFDKL